MKLEISKFCLISRGYREIRNQYVLLSYQDFIVELEISKFCVISRGYCEIRNMFCHI